MLRSTFRMPDNDPRVRGRSPAESESQLSLLPTRVSTIYPGQPAGKHVAFLCAATDGFDYYCKADADGRPIRATEWVAQSLARYLRIAVPEFRIMEGFEGETLFGSRQVISTAGIFQVGDYLSRKKLNEVGGSSDWFGRWLTRLYVLDMWLNNPDRGKNNFVLETSGSGDQLRVIDFADAHLEDITSGRFPVASCNTVCNEKFVESVHGFFMDSAIEMIENIQSIPVSVIEGIIGGMPDDWMADDQKLEIRNAWDDSRLRSRLSALRTGLEDGSRR